MTGDFFFFLWELFLLTTIETPAKSVQLKGRRCLGFSFIHKWKPICLFFLLILLNPYQVCGDVVSSEESPPHYHQPLAQACLQLVMNLMASALEMSGMIWRFWPEVTFPPGPGADLFPLWMPPTCLEMTSLFPCLKTAATNHRRNQMTWFSRAITTYLHVYCTWCVLHALGMSELDARLFTQTCCPFISQSWEPLPPAFCPEAVCSRRQLLPVSEPLGALPCRSTWCRRHQRCTSLQQGPRRICQGLSLSKTSLSPLSIPFQPMCSGMGPLSVSLAPAEGCTPGIEIALECVVIVFPL